MHVGTVLTNIELWRAVASRMNLACSMIRENWHTLYNICTYGQEAVKGYLNRKLQTLRLSQLLDAETRKVCCQIRTKMPGAEDGSVKLVESIWTAKEVAPADTSEAICGSWNKPSCIAWVHAFTVLPVTLKCGPNIGESQRYQQTVSIWQTWGQIQRIHSVLFTSLLFC